MRDFFHVHTYRCGHAENVSDEAYVKRAAELGASSITFTDHAPFPGNPFGNRMAYEQLPEYIDTLQKLKQRYEKLIAVQLFISGKEGNGVCGMYGSDDAGN